MPLVTFAFSRGRFVSTKAAEEFIRGSRLPGSRETIEQAALAHDDGGQAGQRPPYRDVARGVKRVRNGGAAINTSSHIYAVIVALSARNGSKFVDCGANN